MCWCTLASSCRSLSAYCVGCVLRAPGPESPRLPPVEEHLCVFVSANCTGFPQVCDISVNRPWKAALAQSFRPLWSRPLSKNRSALAQEVAKLLTTKRPRELSLDLVDAAISRVTANNGIIITNGVRRVGLHTVYDKAWEPVWTNLERTNSLWQSFSRNDVVVREGLGWTRQITLCRRLLSLPRSRRRSLRDGPWRRLHGGTLRGRYQRARHGRRSSWRCRPAAVVRFYAR